ncbi:MAG: preprotein translocase subunit YajC [Verrucomicrobia bacterium]|nr:MAG: preprotein translocase subunit YajC [Verrucomicrobiota bacterium]
MFSLILAQAQTAAPAQNPASGIGFFVPFMQRLISALKTGDKVVTNAGIHGLIANVKETTVIVKVADNVKIEMEKSAIANVVKSGES